MGKPEVGEVQKAPAGLPGLGGRAPAPPHVHPRPEPSAKDLESVLKKEPAAGPTFANTGVSGASPAKLAVSRARPGKVSPAKTREAQRLAMDGARFMQQRRLAEAITAVGLPADAVIESISPAS